MVSHRHLISLLAAMTLLLAGCTAGEAIVYDSFADISPRGWESEEYAEFRIELPPDTAARYDVDMSVRYDDTYRYTELLASLSCSPSATLPASVQIPLLDSSASPAGNGAHGVYVVSLPLAKGVKLPPHFALAVAPAMNRPILPGVLAIGISITRRN